MRRHLSVIGRNVAGGLAAGAVLGAAYGVALAVGLVTLVGTGPGWAVARSSDLHDLAGLLYMGVLYGAGIGVLLGLAAGILAGAGSAVARASRPGAAPVVAAGLAAATTVLLSPRPLLSGLTPSPLTDAVFLTALPALIAAAAALLFNRTF